jgi:hypothetical protein
LGATTNKEADVMKLDPINGEIPILVATSDEIFDVLQRAFTGLTVPLTFVSLRRSDDGHWILAKFEVDVSDVEIEEELA